VTGALPYGLETALVRVERGGRVLALDDGAASLLGREPAACLGARIEDLLPHPDMGLVMADVAMKPGRRRRLFLRASLPPRHLSVIVSSLVSEGEGELELMVQIVSIDGYMAESDAKAALQFRNTIESVIAGFAHEVRNPIAAILSLTEAALSTMAPACAAARAAHRQAHQTLAVLQPSQAAAPCAASALDASQPHARAVPSRACMRDARRGHDR